MSDVNISQWPIPKIMQLPDHLFGPRWITSVGRLGLNGNTLFDISELALPERCVIWEVMWCADGAAGFVINAVLRLGDQLPAADAEFLALSHVIPDLGIAHTFGRHLILRSDQSWRRMTLRMPLQTAGRRLVGRFIETADKVSAYMIALTVSSMPTSVPECYNF